MTIQQTPPGANEGLYDAKGRFVPMRLIKEIDLLRHQTVLEIIAKAQEASRRLGQFVREANGDIDAFLALSAEKYDTTFGGKKGNLTLTTFDGRFRVQRAIADRLAFDERLQVAKGLIDDCIRRWSEGSRDEVRALVEHAFQVDKEGKISTERVLGLRRIEIDDPTWQEAMKAISDSVTVASSKSYLRFYERQDDGSYRQIPLDISAIGGRL